MIDFVPSHDVLGNGVYSIPEAARLSGIPRQKLRRWLASAAEPDRVWTSDFDGIGDHLELSFTDLMEARVVCALRKQGVTLQYIRKARDIARAEFQLEKPFSTGRFRTDGKRVFWEVEKELGEHDPKLEDLTSGQFVFWSVVAATFKSIDIEDGLARRWWPQDKKRTIVIDPSRSFGQPVVHEFGVPTAALNDAFIAEGDAKIVSRLFELPEKLVNDAVAFEEKLAA